MDHTVQISNVSEVSELSILGVDSRNPWISEDGIRMYFARNPTAGDQSRIYFASRPSMTQPFTTPVMVPNLNITGDGDDGRPWLTQDEQTIVLPIERSGHTHLLMATRTSREGAFGTPAADHLMAVNAVGNDHNDPFLSPDGLRLYLDTDLTPGTFQLRIATRPSITADFSTPSRVPGTETFTGSLGDPALYQGERLLVFSSVMGTASADLWYATRTGASEPFVTATRIPAVNDPGGVETTEMDIILTADGCELYFASTRKPGGGNGNFHIFHAQVAK